jgi:hypothetical protein
MTSSTTSKLLLIACCWPGLAGAQLQVVPSNEPQCAFAAGSQTITVVWRNDSDRTVAMPVRRRLYQASSTSALALDSTQDWKQLQILPYRTVLETISLTFPSVNAGTRFVIQWLDQNAKVLGHTDLMVYPTNLLNALKPLGAGRPLGVFDPQNQIKPLLKAASLEFEDLERTGIKSFSGKLALIFPLAAKASEPENLAVNITELAKTGVAVVWIKPQSTSDPELEPAIYPVTIGPGAVTVVQSRVVANLTASPLAQLNLLRSAELALKPDLLSLSNAQP